MGGLSIALIAGPLGCFIIWQRMAYFGDSLAHSALLGVALGTLLSINVTIGIIFSCLLFSVLLVSLQNSQKLSTDTLLGILAHSLLAIGLIVVSFIEKDHSVEEHHETHIDIHDYLFGDMFTISTEDLIWVYGICIFSAIVLVKIWRGLVALTVNEELAFVEGIGTKRFRLLYIMVIALVTAVSMQLIGILLVTSLLIIPAATSYKLSRSPERMALLASVLGMFEVTAGIFVADYFHLPSGPAIVAVATIVFVLFLPVRSRA